MIDTDQQPHCLINPHISPVGKGPHYMFMNQLNQMTVSQIYSGDIVCPALYLSRSWLVQSRLDLSFHRPIATAIGLSPALCPAAPVRRHHPGYWWNMRVKPVKYLMLLA